MYFHSAAKYLTYPTSENPENQDSAAYLSESRFCGFIDFLIEEVSDSQPISYILSSTNSVDEDSDLIYCQGCYVLS